MTYEVMHGNFSLLPNDTVQKIVHKNLESLGGVSYDQSELQYANEIYQTFIDPDNLIGSQETIRPFKTSRKSSCLIRFGSKFLEDKTMFSRFMLFNHKI